MPQPVNERPKPPSLSGRRNSATEGINKWTGYIITFLSEILASYGRRINTSIDSDGGIAMKAPLTLGTYTMATLPDPTLFEGSIIYVSDGGPGAVFQGSDGAAWINLG